MQARGTLIMGVLIDKLLSLWADKIKPSFLILILIFLLGYRQLSDDIKYAEIGYAYAMIIDGFGVREFNQSPKKIAYAWYKKGSSRYVALRYVCTVDQDALKKRFDEKTVHELCGIR
jgi:hypothetical protein